MLQNWNQLISIEFYILFFTVQGFLFYTVVIAKKLRWVFKRYTIYEFGGFNKKQEIIELASHFRINSFYWLCGILNENSSENFWKQWILASTFKSYSCRIKGICVNYILYRSLILSQIWIISLSLVISIATERTTISSSISKKTFKLQ